MLTLLPASRFPFFVYYAVLGNEIERVQAGLNFLPLACAGLVDPEVGADLVAGLGVGFAEADGIAVDGVAAGADFVNAAGMHDPQVGAAGAIVVDGAAVGAGFVDAAGMHDPQAGVTDGAGMMDAAMQHHIDRVTLIIESEDEGDLPQQGAVAVVPVNLGLLPMNELPQ